MGVNLSGKRPSWTIREVTSTGSTGTTAAQKTRVTAKSRQNFQLELLLEIAQLPRATYEYYYHAKRVNAPDKYTAAKEEFTAIFHQHRRLLNHL